MKIGIENVTKKYGKKYALNQVSLELEDGIYGLLGRNGAGKTTLINILIGILKAEGGQIRIDGVPAQKMGGELLGKLGYLPQYPQFYKEFTVWDFLEYMCVLKAIPRSRTKDRIETLLAEVNLSDQRQKKVGALSGGMRQRLGIASAMVNDPKLLILDEPTAGLDPQERIRFRNLISRFSKDRITILATHIVSDVEYIANQVIIMNEGKILAEGEPEKLCDRLKGQVWDVRCREGEESLDPEKCIVSNMKRESEEMIYHVIGEQLPGAVASTATLEDVFLYLCGGNTHETTAQI